MNLGLMRRTGSENEGHQPTGDKVNCTTGEIHLQSCEFRKTRIGHNTCLILFFGALLWREASLKKSIAKHIWEILHVMLAYLIL